MLHLEESEPDFSDAVDLKIDLHRAVVRLPTMQRVAVLKWLRDERLTTAERKSWERARKSLRDVLESQSG